jgi:hypothetical protein
VWEIVGSTGEWVGALAVVATLFYLANQIRQQNQLARYTAWQTLVREFNEHNNMLLDPKRVQLRRKGLKSPEILAGEDLDTWDVMIRQSFNIALLTWQAHESGVISDDHWIQWARWYSVEFDTPGGRFWRDHNMDSFPEFWNAIDEHRGGPASGLMLNDQLR